MLMGEVNWKGTSGGIIMGQGEFLFHNNFGNFSVFN